jgi:hypothetical protein
MRALAVIVVMVASAAPALAGPELEIGGGAEAPASRDMRMLTDAGSVLDLRIAHRWWVIGVEWVRSAGDGGLVYVLDRARAIASVRRDVAVGRATLEARVGGGVDTWIFYGDPLFGPKMPRWATTAFAEVEGAVGVWFDARGARLGVEVAVPVAITAPALIDAQVLAVARVRL